eukprot:GGOE01003048.1.p1 GENE.GGOE01003048.1~~GGOE01003048.1.p1  ORF type:complete len:911 (-),score=194.94 GGOE01003048.1:134-2866(-)
MIIIFFIDTSVSMNQKLPTQGISLLDAAKCGVEHFIKVRREKADGRNDKYWLFTTDAGGGAQKVGPRESQTNIKDVLKCLVGHSYTRLGPSLKLIFEMLNQARLLHPDPFGLDRHGLGWHPSSVEPAVIILFTDGTLPNHENGVTDSLIIPTLSRVESELTEQPFHWDQRLFSFEIRPPPATVDTFSQMEMLNPRSGLKEQCQATGGNAHVALSLKHLQGLLEQLATKVNGSVVVNLTVEIPKSMEDGELTEKLFQKPVCMVPTNAEKGNRWPIPEDFHVDASLTKLPARRPHPYITLRRSRDFDGVVPPYLVHDVYTLEPGPFTDVLVKKFRAEVWKAYVRRRETNAVEEESFGFVKVDPSTNVAKLFVLPHNYPELLSLLSKVADTGMAVAKNARWRREFEAYVQSIPMYYAGALKEAMKDKRLQLQDLVPVVESEPCQALKDHFKRLKAKAKAECDAWQAERQALLRGPPPGGNGSALPAAGREHRPEVLTGQDVPSVREAASKATASKLGVPDTTSSAASTFLCQSPFDVDRSSLLIQLERMKVAVYSASVVPTITGGERSKAAGSHLESPRVLNPTRLQPIGSRSTISSAASTESLDREIDDAVRKRARFQRVLRRQQQDFAFGQEEMAKHIRSINAMGNYVAHLEKKLASPALRDLRDALSEEEPEGLVVYFGSRYKDKKKRKRPPENIVTPFNVDEAEMSDEVLQTVQRAQQGAGSSDKVAKRGKGQSDGPTPTSLLPNPTACPTGSGDGSTRRSQSHPEGSAGCGTAEAPNPQRARSPSPSAAEDRPRRERNSLVGHPVLRNVSASCVEALADHREWVQFLRVNQAIRFRLRHLLSSDPHRLDGRRFMDLVRALQGSRTCCVRFLTSLLQLVQLRHPKRGQRLVSGLTAHLQGLDAPSDKLS